MKKDNYGELLKIKAASRTAHPYPATDGAVEWICPSNIALVKYWGKMPGQIPMNPSLSLTLDHAHTRTRISYNYEPSENPKELIFRFEGAQKTSFQDRIKKYLEAIATYLPFLKHTSLEIDTDNSFPHSSGIASSASAMGALAICLLNMEEKICGITEEKPFKKASFLARLGSGSASRSLIPEFAIWGASGAWPGSSDEFAISAGQINPSFKKIRDSILIVESGQKQVSSSAGHKLMETNPYARVRFQQAKLNMERIKSILREGDWDGFIDLMEEEALSLHAMMMTGKPGYLLMRDGTLEIIRKVRDFRKESGKHLGFTLDAGANVHLLYDAAHEKGVQSFIDEQLRSHCENGQMIHDRMGGGPFNLNP